MTSNILVVADDPVGAAVLAENLKDKGFAATVCTNPVKAIELVRKESFDLVISDLTMPPMGGIELLRGLRGIDPDIIVIIMTAQPNVSTAVTARKEGAFAYITKPFSNDELLISVGRAIRNLQIVRESAYLRSELGLGPGPAHIIGTSPAMRRVQREIASAARDDAAASLIQGEVGAGKSLAARVIHQMSRRKNEPFIVVNCAAIPEARIESALFGGERDAIRDTLDAKRGRFELADRGTLFLDEITRLNEGAQDRLLRAMQAGGFERAGGIRVQRANVRVIAATHSDLATEVRAGRFRDDLFCLLSRISLHLPPLRERKDDIPLLAEFFLSRFKTEGKGSAGISLEALALLQKYDYPGNVRELENLLEQAVNLSAGQWLTPRELYPLLWG